MDRNDRSYFRRLTPERIDSMFGGYEVPESIRKRVALIMRRFTIFGSCDAMYIANVIAYENGSGDGCGHFDDYAITQVNKITRALMNAYGCNIFPEDKDALEDIIANGTLSKERMLEGLKGSIRTRKRAIKSLREKRVTGDTQYWLGPEYQKATREAEKEADLWRIEFLYGEINVIRDTIKEEEAA